MNILHVTSTGDETIGKDADGNNYYFVKPFSDIFSEKYLGVQFSAITYDPVMGLTCPRTLAWINSCVLSKMTSEYLKKYHTEYQLQVKKQVEE